METHEGVLSLPVREVKNSDDALLAGKRETKDRLGIVELAALRKYGRQRLGRERERGEY